MKHIILTFLLFLSISIDTKADTDTDTLYLTVEKAVEIAVANNPDVRRVQLGSALLDKQIQGAKSNGLPQLNASAGYSDNFTIASQLLPGEIFGQEGQIPVQFGTRFGVNAGLELSQVIYNRSVKTNLKKLNLARSNVRLQSLATMEDLVYNVIQIYIQYQTTVKTKDILMSNRDRVDQLVGISQAQYENGIIKKLDVDQIKVNRNNLITEISNVDISLEQLTNYLRFYLSINQDQTIILTEELDNEVRYPLADELLLNENINYRLLKNQKILAEYDDEVIKAAKYPTLSAYAQYSYTGQANKLNFKSDNYSGFRNGIWGINASINIFDGFATKRKLEENKIAREQMDLDLLQLENAINLEYNNAVTNIRQNDILISNQLDNMDLANEVYEITKMSYQEGVAPLTELLNAETGLKEAQSQYLTALINFKLAELEHVKSSGQLAQLININQ